MTKPVLELIAVSRIFQRGSESVHALASVNFKLLHGQWTALVGPVRFGKNHLNESGGAFGSAQ